MHPLISKLLHGVLSNSEDHLAALEEEIARLTEELAVLTTLRDYLRCLRRMSNGKVAADVASVNGRVYPPETVLEKIPTTLTSTGNYGPPEIGLSEEPTPGAEPSRESTSDSSKSGEDGPRSPTIGQETKRRAEESKTGERRKAVRKYLFENGPTESHDIRRDLDLPLTGPCCFSVVTKHYYFEKSGADWKLTTAGHQEARRLTGVKDD